MTPLEPCGFTVEDRAAWDALAEAARRIMGLEVLHPMQSEEYAHAIHVLQRAMLARPAHRVLIASGEATPPELEEALA